ncbi:Uncharacterised protein [Escherichia coli]|nr:Uncharacterised protein [Enterobacter roggenkampii]VVY94940.1 Uncharacterised protein [Escherichia coli]VVZ82644.1 Uncharacterised protein [Escherichia coli]VWN03048.1 Uncharacterised protein [Escherichia coli]VWN12199.1 Uncharacterised protein [Escherichia coli]
MNKDNKKHEIQVHFMEGYQQQENKLNKPAHLRKIFDFIM